MELGETSTRSGAVDEVPALVAKAPIVEKLDTSAAYRITAQDELPRVVIFGSIHGDEPAGFEAIKALLVQFASGELQLERGSLTLAVGNEEALERRVRKVEKNLNRLFKLEPHRRSILLRGTSCRSIEVHPYRRSLPDGSARHLPADPPLRDVRIAPP
jgi:predicted deacylase